MGGRHSPQVEFYISSGVEVADYHDEVLSEALALARGEFCRQRLDRLGLACSPMLRRGRLLGALAVAGPRYGGLSSSAVSFLEIMAAFLESRLKQAN